MDIAKTRAFYETLASDYVCDCDYCKNYVKEIKRAYPLLADYLQSIGVDIEKPFETMPLEPDKDGYIDYLGVQYIILGNKNDFYRSFVSGVEIDITQSHPSACIEDEYFVIELRPIRLKWTVEPTDTSAKSKSKSTPSQICNSVLLAGLVITAIGLYYLVIKAGIPYQDPTVELQIRYAANFEIGKTLFTLGSLLTLCGGIVRLVIWWSRHHGRSH